MPPITDLAHGAELRRTFKRPPPAMHATVLILLALIGAGLAVAVRTQVAPVAPSHGRVRPVETPQKVFASLGTAAEGRVVDVLVAEGDAVKAGDVLVRLDTEKLENDIQRFLRRAAAAEEELQKLRDIERLAEERFLAARAKAEAELAQVQSEIAQERERRASEQWQAETALAVARWELNRQERLAAELSVSQRDLEEARTKAAAAEETLRRLELPVGDARLEMIRRELAWIEKDYTVRTAELEAQRIVKDCELRAARRELANLRLEREQATVRAPRDGVIVRGEVKAGDVLSPGAAVFELTGTRSAAAPSGRPSNSA